MCFEVTNLWFLVQTFFPAHIIPTSNYCLRQEIRCQIQRSAPIPRNGSILIGQHLNSSLWKVTIFHIFPKSYIQHEINHRMRAKSLNFPLQEKKTVAKWFEFPGFDLTLLEVQKAFFISLWVLYTVLNWLSEKLK